MFGVVRRVGLEWLENLVRYLLIRIDKQKLSSGHLPKVCEGEKEQESPEEGIHSRCLTHQDSIALSPKVIQRHGN